MLWNKCGGWKDEESFIRADDRFSPSAFFLVRGSCEKSALRTTQARMPVPQFGFRVAQAFLPVLVLIFSPITNHHSPIPTHLISAVAAALRFKEESARSARCLEKTYTVTATRIPSKTSTSSPDAAGSSTPSSSNSSSIIWATFLIFLFGSFSLVPLGSASYLGSSGAGGGVPL